MLKLRKGEVGIDPIFESDKWTNSKLYKPDTSKGRCKQGIVKYVGSGVRNVKIGDYVFFSGYAGTVFRLEGEGTLIFMPEDNVYAILDKRTTDIPGLFFYAGNGEYFQANYEQAMTLITRQLGELNYIEIKDQEDLWKEKRKGTAIKDGKLFVIKDQEHEMSGKCFCLNLAKEYNEGVCPKCKSRLHYYSNALNDFRIYHCENMQCQWNTENG